jgi:hypothetical protein
MPRAESGQAEDRELTRSEGGTPSERYLAKLCDHSFLNLWSYPNVYIDKRKDGKGDGKELCDLLVVCGDYVLIFSDKTIARQDGNDVLLSWKRWFNRAVHHSARQIRKAERWIKQMPEHIYLDKSCNKPLPFKLPPLERRKVHGIVVALGVGEACKAHFNEGIGSLMILPGIKGDQHFKGDEVIPFAIGDIDPEGPFIHVLDDATLDIVLGELDTIADLTAYLTKKAEFIRSGQLSSAGGEEELVAYYMVRMNPKGEHDFTGTDGLPLRDDVLLTIGTGHYEHLQKNPQYAAKKDADRHSYVWDTLIKAFTDHMIAGTTIALEGEPLAVSDAEEAVRHMALVPRFTRRILGKSILEVYEKGRDHPRYTRSFLPGDVSIDTETAFFFMTVAVPDRALPGGYQQYRMVRLRMLETQALSLLEKYPSLKRVVGVATEPATSKGSSEDIFFAEDVPWTPELKANLQSRRTLYNIMQEGNMIEQRVDEWEYPAIARKPKTVQRTAPPRMNRKARRAMNARKGRKRQR